MSPEPLLLELIRRTTPGPAWICKLSPDEFETVCDRCSTRDADLNDHYVAVRHAREGDVCFRCRKAIGGAA